jgi:hypothetical protein
MEPVRGLASPARISGKQKKIKGLRRIRGLRLKITPPEMVLPDQKGEFIFDSEDRI